MRQILLGGARPVHVAMDEEAFYEQIREGSGPNMRADLERAMGIVWSPRLGRLLFPTGPGEPLGALDAQPDIVTAPNSGIPDWLSNTFDPKLIEVLVSPMKAATIIGEMQKGSWTSTVHTFQTIESDGTVASYGDFDNNGSVDINTNYPNRQAYHYQTFAQWGERQMANYSLASVDMAQRINIAAALLLNKFQNKSYFFGIQGLKNYGMLNEPNLYPPIAPVAQWNLSGTTAEQIYEDIRRMYVVLQQQSNGVIEMDTPMVLVMSNVLVTALNKTNQFKVNVKAQLRENFPNLRIETAVEYSTDAGELVQLIVDQIEGQEVVTTAFTEKLRNHAVVVKSSSWEQKKSQGTWGTILFYPFGVAQLLGA